MLGITITYDCLVLAACAVQFRITAFRLVYLVAPSTEPNMSWNLKINLIFLIFQQTVTRWELITNNIIRSYQSITDLVPAISAYYTGIFNSTMITGLIKTVKDVRTIYLIDQLIDWLINQLIVWSTLRSIDWLIDWSVNFWFLTNFTRQDRFLNFWKTQETPNFLVLLFCIFCILFESEDIFYEFNVCYFLFKTQEFQSLCMLNVLNFHKNKNFSRKVVNEIRIQNFWVNFS
jgi:hypothetical protein